MTVRVEVPALGESIADADVLEWQKKEGETLEQDDLLLLLETEKVTLEIYAPSAGVLQKTHVRVGDKVKEGDILAEIDAQGTLRGSGKAKTSQRDVLKTIGRGGGEKPVADTQQDAKAHAPPQSPPPPSPPPSSPPVPHVPVQGVRPPLPSAQRHMAQEGQGASMAHVTGTGRGGQVTKQDVLSARLPSASPASPMADGDDEMERTPLSSLRRLVAMNLKTAQREAALLTTFNEIDMSRVIALRQAYQSMFQERYGIKLGFSSFFVKAVVSALAYNPIIHAWIDGEEKVQPRHAHIGIAVASPQGLIVPVLRYADRMDFAHIERSVADYVARAKTRRLDMASLSGGTFTITNGGVFGSLLSTPIVNPPQSAILGLHAIKERPVVVDGDIVVRPMMYVALTYDHRLIDGREAVTFLAHVKHAIESPDRMLLGV
ncbi:MAG: 2-oxoglutarate dehydrogenase complex dihydrolipoyllysine-residue succinyltransferase [Alphaproteobacteria bacterium GM7ARS4]|nr:2-oxoglutarate dehydrogenase complex dihydrolipoyllysine-residue succinyltransferase [Alphaproteobacteria bacterium GM7ARS4]